MSQRLTYDFRDKGLTFTRAEQLILLSLIHGAIDDADDDPEERKTLTVLEQKIRGNGKDAA